MHSSVTFGVTGLGLGVQVQVWVQATMYWTSVPAQHITFVVMFDCVPVADAGVLPPVRPPCPPLHLVDVAGVKAAEVSNTNA